MEEQLESLPFPVLPCQRKVLQGWKDKAVAKEAQLVARKEQKLEELRVYVEQRISAKKERPKQVYYNNSGREGGGSALKPLIPFEEHKDEDLEVPSRPLLTATETPATSATTTSSTTRTTAATTAATASRSTHRVTKQPGSLLGARVKGFLTRRLYLSNKVQLIATTIKDALGVLSTLTHATTKQDRDLKLIMQNQLMVARMTFHEIFFQLSPAVQMTYISHSRALSLHKKQAIPKAERRAIQNPTGRAADSAEERFRPIANLKHSGSATTTTTSQASVIGHVGGNNNRNSKPLQVGGGKLSTATIKSMQRRQKCSRAT